MLTTRFAFFVRGLGREFCLLVPPFPRWAWFEKSKRPWNDAVEAEKSSGCKRQIHLVLQSLPSTKAMCLIKKGFCSKFGLSFSSPFSPGGFFSISHSQTGPVSARKKSGEEGSQMSIAVLQVAVGLIWVDGWMVGSGNFQKCLEEWPDGVESFRNPGDEKKTVEVAGFFFASAAMVWCGE